MSAVDTIITIAILAVLALIVYTKMRKQSFNETFEDIKNLFTPAKTAMEEMSFPKAQPI